MSMDLKIEIGARWELVGRVVTGPRPPKQEVRVVFRPGPDILDARVVEAFMNLAQATGIPLPSEAADRLMHWLADVRTAIKDPSTVVVVSVGEPEDAAAC